MLFFHSGWAIFSGGYVGVDVFFVISGYLITGILAAEIAQARFSIIAFYERRIRRIFPCLLAVIIASSMAAAFLLVPMDFRDFAKSVVATLFFASNVLFFRQSGYFDEQSEMKPMLHTWSLAVEEQYYIFFPILLWLTHRYARDRMFLLLVPLAILSFAVSVWGVRHMPAFTFFMAPTRIWELFAGALLALGLVPAIEKRALREAAPQRRRRPISEAAVRASVRAAARYCSFVASCFASSIPRNSGSPTSAFPIASRARSLRPFADIATA